MADGNVDLLNRVFRVTTKMTVRQQHIQTSFHLRDIGIPNQTPNDVLTHAKVWLNSSFRTILSNQITVDRMEVEDIRTKDFASEDFVSVTGLQNQGVASTLLAVCVSLKSSNRSRNSNGRMFWPLLDAPQGDQINSGSVALYTAAAAYMADRYISGAVTLEDYELVVVGKELPSLDPLTPNPKRWTRVKTVRINPLVTSLRSRKVGIGN